MTAEVTRRGALNMQVCVPAEWGDAEILAFAERLNPCGTEHGWSIRKSGDTALKGDPERQPCTSRSGHVHVMLDA